LDAGLTVAKEILDCIQESSASLPLQHLRFASECKTWLPRGFQHFVWLRSIEHNWAKNIMDGSYQSILDSETIR
jgi:hypothetical protein